MAALRESVQVYRLARDLGIRVSKPNELVPAMMQYCEQQISQLMQGLPGCETLTELLGWVANRLGTSFIMIHTDEDLQRIKQEYLERRELGFVQLEDELAPHVFGLTIKLQNRESWEPEFVSIIDCRGEKAMRSYFTKWHELAHLLTLTRQKRWVFKRTHASVKGNDPEERLMDILAGHFGFYPPIARKFMNGEISFNAIERLREQLCPEASLQSSFINFVRGWNHPCILLRAEPALKKDEEAQLCQGRFDFLDAPQPALRVVQVSPNDLARERRFTIHKNMRVPEHSIISWVFSGTVFYDEAEECLSWWETSYGARLARCAVRVKAKRSGQSVEALVMPLGQRF
jgi:hypothetical protein